MVNLHKIKTLAKDKGWSLSFLCSKMGVAASYFTDVKNGRFNITSERLLQISGLLNTTPEYLTDKSDTKNPTTNSDGVGYVFGERDAEMLKLYEQLSPELQKVAREHLRLLLDSLDDKDNQ